MAAFVVVLAHVPLSQFSSVGISDDFFGFGAIGVDIFFVISGFIMFYVTENTKSGIEQAIIFLSKRILRVVPLYWLFLFVAISLCYISVNSLPWVSVCPHWLAYNYDISNLNAATIIKSFTFTNFSSNPIYSIGWTLIYEFWFYFFISLSILLGFNRFYSFTIIIAITLLSYILKNPITYSVFNVLFNPFMIEFGYGMLLYSIWFHRRLSLRSSSILFLLFNVINLALKHTSIFEHPLYRALIWGGIAFSFVSLALFYEAKIVINKYFKYLGNTSYSLYLMHWLVVTTIPYFLVIYSINLNFIFFVIFNVFISVSLSIFLYHFVERHIAYVSKSLFYLIERPLDVPKR